MPILDLLAKFQQDLAHTDQYVQDAFSTNPNGGYIFRENFRNFIVEAAIVKIVVAWETFLEGVFTYYSMAEPSISGLVYSRYSNPPNLEHARKMAIGTQKYVEWSNPSIVLSISKLYFDSGEPFKSVIAGISDTLSDLRVIRNAAAHLSSTTKTPFEAVAAKIFGLPSPGITVADFLVRIHPTSTTNETVFAIVIKTLDAAACAIVR